MSRPEEHTAEHPCEEADANPAGLPADVGVPGGGADGPADNGPGPKEDSEREYNESWRFLDGELSRQHGLLVGQYNSLVQRSGMILAFSPLLLLEAMKLWDPVINGGLHAAAALLALSFLLGVFAVMSWVRLRPSFGSNVKELIYLYYAKDWKGLDSAIHNGKMSGIRQMKSKINILNMLLNIEVALLLAGVASLAHSIGWF
ncbi:MAG: hypothetical protein LBT41_05820 [Candidatus Methanoplasma sp.]|jgi:hypothetical protein|nr:hypothetical protein [Candidatus Methanoplasma sp.]